MPEKMTEAQRDMLEWLASTDLEVAHPVVADKLVAMGYAYCLHDSQTGEDFYRITPAGRSALASTGGTDAE